MGTHPSGHGSPFGAEPSLRDLSTAAAADVVRSGGSAGAGSGFGYDAIDTGPKERIRLGAPPWFFPSVLGVLGAIVLACVALAWYDGEQNKADRSVFDHTTISAPANAAGLTLGAGPGVQSVQGRVNVALGNIGVVSAVSGSYLSTNGTSYAVGAVGKRITPPNQLVTTAEEVKKHFVGETGAAAITLDRTTPGPLGGTMRCGPFDLAGLAATYCVAVDEGSVAEFVVATGDVAAASTTARAMRAGFITRR